MEQAALLRAYAVDRIHERDSLVEVALAFVANTAEAQSNCNGADAGDNGYDPEAVEELLEWRRRLGEETKELDPGTAVDGKRSGQVSCTMLYLMCVGKPRASPQAREIRRPLCCTIFQVKPLLHSAYARPNKTKFQRASSFQEG